MNNFELLFVSLLVVTWMSYGIHVIKEFIRNHVDQEKGNDTTEFKKAKSIQTNYNESRKWLETCNEC